jgi:Spy/CpxP family protein refolding chaperone
LVSIEREQHKAAEGGAVTAEQEQEIRRIVRDELRKQNKQREAARQAVDAVAETFGKLADEFDAQVRAHGDL